MTLRRISTAIAAAAVTGGTALSASAGASPVQYANPAASGSGASASYASGTWVLASGHGAGGGAQIDLVNPGTAQTAPAFTADHQYAGNPRWVIEFHNGCYLFGSPVSGTMTWTLEPSGTAEASYAAALAAAQACGADDTVTAAFVVLDTGNPDVTVKLTDVTYNGEAVVQAPAPVTIPRFYGGHAVSTSPVHETVWFGDTQPGTVKFEIHGPGKINGHTGWVRAVKGLNAGYYTGLEANHGYEVVYTAYTAVNGKPILRANGTPDSGTVYFVSNR